MKNLLERIKNFVKSNRVILALVLVIVVAGLTISATEILTEVSVKSQYSDWQRLPADYELVEKSNVNQALSWTGDDYYNGFRDVVTTGESFMYRDIPVLINFDPMTVTVLDVNTEEVVNSCYNGTRSIEDVTIEYIYKKDMTGEMGLNKITFRVYRALD
jgi:hypothetical protein